MFLTENQQKWSNIITEEYGVKDQSKLAWMSQYAQNHEIFEGVQSGAVDGGIYATPLNTMGIGNPMMPYNAEKPGYPVGQPGGLFGNQRTGSGDIPMTTLNMALEVAAMTIGLELVPVIPANGPWAMLSYMDFPYAGGKLGRINEAAFDGKGEGNANKPIYIKFNATITKAEKEKFVQGTTAVKVGDLKGIFMGFSRIDGNMIVEVKDCGTKSIAEVFEGKNTVEYGTLDAANAFTKTAALAAEAAKMRPELVTGAADHIQNFSNFMPNNDGNPMSRAENETGVGNTIGARMFTKMVQMGAYEVTGAVTRQQLQDMPLYGVDVIGKVLEAMQNEISQAINNRILDRLFKLGTTNAENQYAIQGVDLNLYLGDATTKEMNLAKFKAFKKYQTLDGTAVVDRPVKNAIQNTAAENLTTHQRRIMSRVLAAANLIANVSRRGRAHWIVTNTQVLTALQDAANFVIAPMVNNLVQDGSKSLYFAGSIAGLNVYVDPYMQWNDTRICVGSKSTGNDPGVVFMPYILADTIQITAEGTMAPKLLVNSRYAIVDAGFYPEQRYYTFMVESANDVFLI